MKNYLVSYDLNQPQQQYAKLYEKLRQLNAKQLLKSAYLVKSNGSAEAVYNDVKACIDTGDRIFVSEITENRQGWVSKDIWEWLNASFAVFRTILGR